MLRFSLTFHRIAQDDYKTYLKGILDNNDLVTGTLEEMASELQRKFEAIVADENDIYERACKGTYYSFKKYICSMSLSMVSLGIMCIPKLNNGY